MRHSPRRGAPRWAGFLVLLSSLGLFGCGGGGTGTVSGKVYYKEKPLKGGTVTFLTADAKVVQAAKIGEDGSYTIDKMLAGPVKITVETKSLNLARTGRPNAPPPGQTSPNKQIDPKELAKRYIPIPPEYAEAETSGLDYVVKPGSQPFDIRLK